MMGVLAANLSAGALKLEVVEWPDAHSFAERLSAKHTMSGGHRPMDILHLASAIQLGIKQFLTFDVNQKNLAEVEGFKVPLWEPL